MSLKRLPEGPKGESDGGGSPEEKRQKIPSFKAIVDKAMQLNRFQKLLEPLVRKVVKEEVESALANYLASMTQQCGEQIIPSTSRNLHLQFKNKLSLPIFTGSRIEGEDCSVITIALVNALTGQAVVSGPESSMKVEIVVLEGDFEGGEEENWTYEEFKNNIVKEREGKRTLLSGEIVVELNEGIGVIGELSFTDNSSWTRSRKFRLGAKVVDGYFSGMRIREARTEPFMVKDHRGELYKKHYPPSLQDEVWRLEKIGKDGAFHRRLSIANINTVKDFLTLLFMDATRLRYILGSGMSTKMWEVTVEHARTCIVSDQLHVYYPNGSMKPGIVFSVVGQVRGLISEQQFVTSNDLSDNEMAEAQAAVKLAFEHWNDVLTCDTGAVLSSTSNAPPNSFVLGSQSSQDNVYNTFQSSVKADGFGSTHASIPSPDIFSIGVTTALDAYGLQPVDDMESGLDAEPQSLMGRDAFKDTRDLEKISSPLISDECGSQTFFGEDSLQQYMDSNFPLLSHSLGADSSDLGTAVTGFLAMSAARTAAVQGKAYRGWRTLLSVLRWIFSIKRIVALKKKMTHGKERFG